MAAMDGPLTATAAARVPPGSTARRDRTTRSYVTCYSLLSAPLALLSPSPPGRSQSASSFVARRRLLAPQSRRRRGPSARGGGNHWFTESNISCYFRFADDFVGCS